jgi:hypothetical protein
VDGWCVPEGTYSSTSSGLNKTVLSSRISLECGCFLLTSKDLIK